MRQVKYVHICISEPPLCISQRWYWTDRITKASQNRLDVMRRDLLYSMIDWLASFFAYLECLICRWGFRWILPMVWDLVRLVSHVELYMHIHSFFHEGKSKRLIQLKSVPITAVEASGPACGRYYFPHIIAIDQGTFFNFIVVFKYYLTSEIGIGTHFSGSNAVIDPLVVSMNIYLIG